MNEREANIDLAFRNGLKDYEVLPPAGAWDNIQSRIYRKEKPAYLLRAAAFVAIAMTLSVLANWWIGKIPLLTELTPVAGNIENTTPSIENTVLAPVPVKTDKDQIPVRQLVAANEETTGLSETTEADLTGITVLPLSNKLVFSKYSSLDIVKRKTDLNVSKNSLPDLGSDGLSYGDYQTVETSSGTTGRWSIAALASPTYYGKFSSGSDELSRQIASSEQAVVSYTGGVALAYRVNRRFSIQSGLFYSSVGQELDGINSFSGFRKYDYTKGDHNFELLTTNGTVHTNNADIFLFAEGNNDRLITNYNNDVFDPQKASLDYINNTMKQSFSYLELPVFLRYKVIDKTFGVNLIGGLSYNMLIDNSVYTVVDGNKYMIGTTQGLNMFSISSSFGMGMEYKFSDKLSLNLEPTFRYYMNSFNNISGAQFHPYSFGVFSGLSYKF